MRDYIFALEFISKLLSEVPSPEILQQLTQNPIADHWPVTVEDDQGQQGLELIQQYAQGDVTALRKQLEQDFFTLFEMSPPRCYIHESVWLSNDKLLYDEQTFAVREFYAKYGLQAHSSDKGPDDHLGLELSFLAYLLNRNEEEQEGQDELQADIKRFLQEHLLKWAPECLAKISQEAETDFYRGVGMLGAGTLAQLQGLLAGE